MTAKNILVAFNDSPSAEKAADAALAFQARFDTHITGLGNMGPARLSAEIRGWLSDSVTRALRQAEQQLYDDVAAKWHQLTKDRVADNKRQWLQLDGNADTAIIEQARFYDLTFVGQYDTGASDSHMIVNPDKIALQSGRPVMVVPTAFERGPITDHVVLAWDGKRAATRALADALYVFGNSLRITILTVGEKAGAKANIPGLLQHLDRKGCQADHHHIALDRKRHSAIARAIIDYCSNIRPDCLIMGAYEHSKFREDSVGGVTETIFREATLPVLMSH